jgi:hypothetical protein
MPRKRGGQPNGYTPAGPDFQPTAVSTSEPMPTMKQVTKQIEATPNNGDAGMTSGPNVAGGNLEAALASLQGQSYQPAFSGPSPRPDIPFTAGLPSGPGPGPEIFGVQTKGRVTGMLQRMAQTSGNAVLASLADEAAAQNI